MKKHFKKIFCMIVCATLVATQFGFLTNVSAATKVLKVYNWDDYEYRREEGFDLDFKEDFEKAYKAKFGEEIKLEFSYFTTPEEMLTKIETGKEDFDLACPSDYMIQQMMQKDLLKKIDTSKLENFGNLSPFIRAKHEEFESATGKAAADDTYSISYMWGTMGLLYNPEYLSDKWIESMKDSWDILFDKEMKGKVLMKDSMRDTYVISAVQSTKDILAHLREMYPEDYLEILDYVLNNTSDENIERIENLLIKQKKDVKPKYEVDDGKTDMVTGKYWVNLAWSGDARWAIDEAAELGTTLEYVIPKIGSNLWFDGWVLPKYGKAENSDAAHFFIDFTLNSETAINNMDYIGYTSGVGTQEVADWIAESAESGAQNADLDYFFEGTGIVAPTGMPEFMYPTTEEVSYCAIMKDFGGRTVQVAEMWSRMKSSSSSLTVTLIIMASVIAAGLIAVVVIYIIRKKNDSSRGGGASKVVKKQQTTAFRPQSVKEESTENRE